MKKPLKRSLKSQVSVKKSKLSGVQIADQLGNLAAQIRPLKDEEKSLKEEIIKLARRRTKSFDGQKYRATVSFAYNCETLDPDMVRKYLTPAQIKKCTNYGDRITVTVRGLKTS